MVHVNVSIIQLILKILVQFVLKVLWQICVSFLAQQCAKAHQLSSAVLQYAGGLFYNLFTKIWAYNSIIKHSCLDTKLILIKCNFLYLFGNIFKYNFYFLKCLFELRILNCILYFKMHNIELSRQARQPSYPCSEELLTSTIRGSSCMLYGRFGRIYLLTTPIFPSDLYKQFVVDPTLLVNHHIYTWGRVSVPQQLGSSAPKKESYPKP